MYRIYKNILHSFQGDLKKVIYFRSILWLICWSLQDDQGGITCMLVAVSVMRPRLLEQRPKALHESL